ncbi:hypothetical protein BT96DRAFT_975499 [Gymnopus androsaceus JB14]|uniref:Nephrocystin 3-like N-terminal domain-containing protein n=1 Tax=Gymnopus androsaceus JB14 TaxID=1447944 RepID=A0A6A4HSY3_9AGAR|nr:hypothetical protein BT96DRAFT_975499 [Gymnopus androsaceus JB14]
MSSFSNAHEFTIHGGEFSNVQGNQKNIKQKLASKLNPDLNAHIQEDKECLEGTRIQIIEKITQWAMNRKDDTPQAFILYGAAGTGKSAISHTIGKKFKKMNCLGGFFCFNCTFHAERTATRAIQSIAYTVPFRSRVQSSIILKKIGVWF